MKILNDNFSHGFMLLLCMMQISLYLMLNLTTCICSFFVGVSIVDISCFDKLLSLVFMLFQTALLFNIESLLITKKNNACPTKVIFVRRLSPSIILVKKLFSKGCLFQDKKDCHFKGLKGNSLKKSGYRILFLFRVLS